MSRGGEHIVAGDVGAGERAFMTKAISASMRGWMNRPAGIVAPFETMSSSSTPLSGMSMLSACCMALGWSGRSSSRSL
jgi:hypothetical protein